MDEKRRLAWKAAVSGAPGGLIRQAERDRLAVMRPLSVVSVIAAGNWQRTVRSCSLAWAT